MKDCTGAELQVGDLLVHGGHGWGRTVHFTRYVAVRVEDRRVYVRDWLSGDLRKLPYIHSHALLKVSGF